VNASGGGGTTGSWSEGWNFTVNITDEDGDTVYLTLWKRKFTAGSGWGAWQTVDTKQYSSCTTRSLTYTRAGRTPPPQAGQLVVQVQCDGQRGLAHIRGTEYGYEVNGSNYTIEKDDMNITYYAGNGQNLDRNGSATLLVSVLVYDMTRPAIFQEGGRRLPLGDQERNGLRDRQQRDRAEQRLHNYSFSPDARIMWPPALEDRPLRQRRIQGYHSSSFNVTLYTYLNGSIDYPVGQTFPQGDPIPMWFSVWEGTAPPCPFPAPHSSSL